MSNLKVVRFLILTFVAAGLVAPAMAQQPAAALTMKQLKPNVWVGLGGSGGNSTIIIGQTGVIVVDAKQTEQGAKDLLAEIAKITPKPVKTVILTHSDGDHVNGLVAYPVGIEIIAHENNKKELQAAIDSGARGAPPKDRLPTRVTTKEKEATTIDGVKLELYHFAPAHTSGDLMVYLPNEKIVSTGDIIVTNRADDNPNVHFEKNGRTDGWLTTVKGLIKLNADTYVTGHGDLLMKADLQRKFDATTARRNKIAEMIKEGKTLDQVKAALPDAPAPGAAPAAPRGPAPAAPAGAAPGAGAAAAPRGGGTPAKTFVETAYGELAKK